MDEKQTPENASPQPQAPSAIRSILKEISSKKNPPSSAESAKTPLDNLKNVLTAADSTAQQAKSSENQTPPVQKNPQMPSEQAEKANPIAIKTIHSQQTSEKISASAGPSANRVLVDSEAVRKLDELIQAHRAGKP